MLLRLRRLMYGLGLGRSVCDGNKSRRRSLANGQDEGLCAVGVLPWLHRGHRGRTGVDNKGPGTVADGGLVAAKDEEREVKEARYQVSQVCCQAETRRVTYAPMAPKARFARLMFWSALWSV